MNMIREIPLHIELRVYFREADFLGAYFKRVWYDLDALGKYAPDQHFVLVEYYKKQFVKDHLRISRQYKRVSKKKNSTYGLNMPVSIARILWKNWQNEVIFDELKNVLGGIDGCLKNLNLEPHD
ncbi:hypothetical protein [Runella sp. SP2]|uniref:hypothetical protein n=1 Tax=Runella sp. SP2 TaxID=2268026 RepID=UPI000F077750|nr:hypothetical protein [Runella sp. SP2]AYQ31421.1 hypothetical protein DTQ70_04155 [Runella sp. SP2]